MDKNQLKRAGEVLEELKEMALEDGSYFTISYQRDDGGRVTRVMIGTDDKLARIIIGEGALKNMG